MIALLLPFRAIHEDDKIHKYTGIVGKVYKLTENFVSCIHKLFDNFHQVIILSAPIEVDSVCVYEIISCFKRKIWKMSQEEGKHKFCRSTIFVYSKRF